MVMIFAILVLTLGKQLWTRYVPKYLGYLGASVWVIGLYDSIKRVVKALYQYPGGWASDKLAAKFADMYGKRSLYYVDILSIDVNVNT